MRKIPCISSWDSKICDKMLESSTPHLSPSNCRRLVRTPTNRFIRRSGCSSTSIETVHIWHFSYLPGVQQLAIRGRHSMPFSSRLSIGNNKLVRLITLSNRHPIEPHHFPSSQYEAQKMLQVEAFNCLAFLATWSMIGDDIRKCSLIESGRVWLKRQLSARWPYGPRQPIESTELMAIKIS